MRTSSSVGFDLREAVESLRTALRPRGGATDSAPGDIRTAVLVALTREPMNGHQVMRSLAASSGGAWMPAASSVYPMLQQLTDEGLVTAQHQDERTVYTLTEAGRAAAAAATHEHEHDTDDSHDEHPPRPEGGWSMPRWNDAEAAVPKAGAKLAQAAAQIAHSGTREQKERAAALLDETRRQLYAILAEG